ncbi:hypothetical protein [Paraclostridium sordellii]|uniref:hypothetical protein n=1 Tax=Paraclostridium sordellii TaxID=1505 RepID=UPI00038663A1|nr:MULTISPECIES: hypothetical protein [Paeniclostridium]EPZ57885.1 putative membrane protein [[Clostridium] sordellii VPI 9048] [Paeniclostridium sordellii VPI 9048]MBS6023463.1 hypothetical protein [Paeniclostridium sordellii]MBW4862103.1 hypothetical protein [Paeniclostridium sp.]MBW4875420.1 hypothetical protein [Paeniclostridium sp.]MCH1965607.1 hypothetical protein [Paeniclostridium sordellii]
MKKFIQRINPKFYVYAYILYNLFVLNFIKMDVNLDTLNGSAVLNLNLLTDFSWVFLIQQILFLVVFYFYIKEKKWVNSLILISMVLNVFSAFMIIETANFSLYNIILILSILTGVMGVYSMIHLQGN